MLPWKHRLVSKNLFLILLALQSLEQVGAQVIVDVRKITCDQFVTYKIENPRYLAAWLSGYYHGIRGDMTVDPNALIADADKVVAYCFKKPEAPLVEAVKTVLGISLEPGRP